MAIYSNIKIQGTNRKKITIIIVLLVVYYYFYYYKKGKKLTAQDIQTFLGDTVFFIALQNSPLILF
jgi:hypothetical protein